jgi:hypothetical protein
MHECDSKRFNLGDRCDPGEANSLQVTQVQY